MPTIPAPLATYAERLLGHPVTVSAVARLSPGLRRVRFTGESLRGVQVGPGQEVEFRVGDTALRHYTIVHADPAAAAFDVVFCGHSPGPGAAWARALAPGLPATVLGPGDGVRLRPGTRHVLLGDATALGLFAAVVPMLLPSADAVFGAVAVPEPDADATADLVPELDILTCPGTPGTTLVDWLAGRRPTDGDRYVLVGHAQSLQALRAQLRGAGVPRAAITTKAYWATGRRGL